MNESRDQEPPLHGKQLVFVFMAATVAAVVIFLAGVMVGRGVRLQRGGFAVGEMAADPTLDPAPPLAAPTGTTAQGPSPASREGLTYPTQLSELNPPDVLAEPAEDPTAEVLGRAIPKEPARPAAAPVKPEAPSKAEPAALAKPLLGGQRADGDAAATTAPGKSAAAAAAAKVPGARAGELGGGEAGKGYAVQVAAVRDRSEADRIATRLKGKGYATYITSPAPGMFRVRVGKFEQLREAEATAARLEKEEQFKPWITK
jgi:cell division septation protein DedD